MSQSFEIFSDSSNVVRDDLVHVTENLTGSVGAGAINFNVGVPIVTPSSSPYVLDKNVLFRTKSTEADC